MKKRFEILSAKLAEGPNPPYKDKLRVYHVEFKVDGELDWTGVFAIDELDAFKHAKQILEETYG